jgi:hypothetical protein
VTGGYDPAVLEMAEMLSQARVRGNEKYAKGPVVLKTSAIRISLNSPQEKWI